MPFMWAHEALNWQARRSVCTGGCAGSPILGRTMSEWRVDLQNRAGVALRTFLPQDLGRNAKIMTGYLMAELEIPLTGNFVHAGATCSSHVRHFGLCLSPLTAYHYHIRRPSSRSPSENYNPGIKVATYVNAQLVFLGFSPSCDISPHLTGPPNSRTVHESRIAYRETRISSYYEGTHTPAHTHATVRNICHPGRNTNAIRVSPL